MIGNPHLADKETETQGKVTYPRFTELIENGVFALQGSPPPPEFTHSSPMSLNVHDVEARTLLLTFT